jgi:hypothetical protein
VSDGRSQWVEIASVNVPYQAATHTEIHLLVPVAIKRVRVDRTMLTLTHLQIPLSEVATIRRERTDSR